MSKKEPTVAERIQNSDVETLEALSDMIKSKAKMIRSEAEIMHNFATVSKTVSDTYVALIENSLKEEIKE